MTGQVRLGFLGLGWIGRHRLEAMLATGQAQAVGFVDPSPTRATGLPRCDTLEALLDVGLDGLVIATPSALHAEQAIAALERNVAVFCQKPLGRNAAEVGAVVAASRAANRLLGVDLSYRCTQGMQRIRDLIGAGMLGRVYAADLIFHNAYGPDKPWFYDSEQSGGGCVIDLGVHLVDLALWALDFPAVQQVSAQLFSSGQRLTARSKQVEDYATATLDLAGGATIRLACSWRLHAGQDAVISAAFHGVEGGAAFRNVGGSFYDFTAEHNRGTTTETLTMPPDAWDGRAAADWVGRLAMGDRFDPDAEKFLAVAQVLDQIYARGAGRESTQSNSFTAKRKLTA